MSPNRGGYHITKLTIIVNLNNSFCLLLVSFEKFFFTYLFIHITIGCVLFIFNHQQKYPEWNFIEHIVIRQVQSFHERCNLSRYSLTCYYRVSAIRLRTFLAKSDSIIKPLMSSIDRADTNADTTSDGLQSIRTSVSLSSSCKNQDSAAQASLRCGRASNKSDRFAISPIFAR